VPKGGEAVVEIEGGVGEGEGRGRGRRGCGYPSAVRNAHALLGKKMGTAVVMDVGARLRLLQPPLSDLLPDRRVPVGKRVGRWNGVRCWRRWEAALMRRVVRHGPRQLPVARAPSGRFPHGAWRRQVGRGDAHCKALLSKAELLKPMGRGQSVGVVHGNGAISACLEDRLHPLRGHEACGRGAPACEVAAGADGAGAAGG